MGGPGKKVSQTEMKGHTGNVVPFFPTEWRKNANDIFNQILQGGEATEVAEETSNAAIY